MPPDLVYVGTYTRSGRSEGIHVFRHDARTGTLSHLFTTPVNDPSFLAFDPRRQYLFAVSEGIGRDQGAVESFRIDQTTGQLTSLSRQPTGGGEPCHLCTDPSGRWLLVANHEHGSVAVLPIDAEGRLGPRTHLEQHTGSGPGPTQQGPHAHFVTFDPPQQRVLVCDKGIDQVRVYQLDTRAGKLVPNDPPAGRLHPGAAPRHLAFHPNGRLAYVNGEADMTLTAFRYEPATGALEEIQFVSTVPQDADRSGCSTAQVLVEPGGHFVYVSNRGHDSIAGFAIEPETGRLTPLGNVPTQGRTPRNFAFDPSGQWLYAANQNSDNVVAFRLDQRSGALQPSGGVTDVGAPVCLLFS